MKGAAQWFESRPGFFLPSPFVSDVPPNTPASSQEILKKHTKIYFLLLLKKKNLNMFLDEQNSFSRLIFCGVMRPTDL